MKKLLYAGVGLALAGVVAYFNLDKLDKIVNRSLASEIMPPEQSPEFPYFKNQFIVNFTNDENRNAAIRNRLSTVYGLNRMDFCPCGEKIQLWGKSETDIEVELDPDNDPPKPPPGILPIQTQIGSYLIL
jgi:hypothetical protein